MWRMQLNDELASVAMATRRDRRPCRMDGVASRYTCRPDCAEYGKQMKDLSHSYPQFPNSLNLLPDSTYLVYGIPRVSLLQSERHRVASSSFDPKTGDISNGHRRSSDEDNAISVSSSIGETRLHGDNSIISSNINHQSISQLSAHQTDELRNSESSSPGNNIQENIENTAIQTEIRGQSSRPQTLEVRKSREFWEKIANKKTEIIKLGKYQPPVTNNANAPSNAGPVVLTSDLLQTQHKRLRKTVTQHKTGRDRWKTLAARKHEIILQAQQPPSSDSSDQKKGPKKTTHLWGFIFAKKKDILHIKRGGHKPESSNSNASRSEAAPKQVEKPSNFEDPFQRELAERLRKRRAAVETLTHE